MERIAIDCQLFPEVNLLGLGENCVSDSDGAQLSDSDRNLKTIKISDEITNGEEFEK